MKRPYFHNPTHQTQYEQDGYVVLPMLSPEEVAEFRALFEEIRPKEVTRMYSNVQDQPYEINKRVDDRIKACLTERMAAIFINCTEPRATLMAKGIDDESECNFHQDWTTVDELSDYQSFTYWIPLIDVDEHNGALWVIKGSHRLFKTYRSFNFPSAYFTFTPDVEAVATLLPMKAGQVCIFANTIFHGSKRNYSDTVRVTITGGILPAETPNIHYYYDEKDNMLNVWQVDHDFYYREMPMIGQGKIPDYLPVIRRIRPERTAPSKAEVFEALYATGRHQRPLASTTTPIEKPSFWKRLFGAKL